MSSIDQFIITDKKLQKMLAEAFQAGYESPVELLEQEVAKIYNKHIAKGKLTQCIENQEKPKKANSKRLKKSEKNHSWMFGISQEIPLEIETEEIKANHNTIDLAHPYIYHMICPKQ